MFILTSISCVPDLVLGEKGIVPNPPNLASHRSAQICISSKALGSQGKTKKWICELTLADR